jgi:hypothetical protein
MRNKSLASIVLQFITFCYLLVLVPSCSKQESTINIAPGVTLNKALIEKIAADPDFVPLTYMLNKKYLKLRVAAYAKDSADVQGTVKQITRVYDYYYHYAFKLQEKYKLQNTVAYIQAAYNISKDAKKLDFNTPLKQVLANKKKAVTSGVVSSETSRVIVVQCPSGTLFNPNTIMCDWPENVPEGSTPYFLMDGETGQIMELPNVTVYGTGNCYKKYRGLFDGMEEQYACGWQSVFGNNSQSPFFDYEEFMRDNKTSENCDDNAMLYLFDVYTAQHSLDCEEEDDDGSGGGTYLSSTTAILQRKLNLSSFEALWLENNPSDASELLTYIQNTNRSEANAIATEHLNAMINNPDYLSFVRNHQNTGSPGMVWWEDAVWLDNPQNFSFDITNAPAFEELNAQEVILVALYPIQAYSIKLNIPVSIEFAQNSGLPGPLNGKQDAFRHAFFNAINTRDVPARLIGPGATSGSNIVRLFAAAHESSTPSQLNLEKQMDLFNNEVGISYCWNCWTTSNNNIRNAILTKLNNGELRYLVPLLEPSQDPNFSGTGGTDNPRTATHGITTNTSLKPTNQ